MALFQYINHINRLIGRKAIIICITISIFTAVFITIIHIIFEYRQSVQKINDSIENVGNSNIEIFSRYLESNNKTILKTQMDRLLNIEGIEYLSVSNKKNKILETGYAVSRHSVSKTFSIKSDDGENKQVPELYIVAGIDSIYHTLLKKGAILLTGYLIVSILISIFSIFIFSIFRSTQIIGRNYRSLFDYSLNGLFYCKMIFSNGSPDDFIFLDVNNSFESLTGLKDVIGKKASEIIPGILQSDPEMIKIFGQIALSGKPERFDFYFNALKQWFSASVYSPEKQYLIATFNIITEQKRVENEIRISNELLHMTGETAKIGGWEFDTGTLEGTWTDTVAMIFDLDPGQVTNVPYSIGFFEGESRNKIEKAVKDAIELAKPYDLELELISAKGIKKIVRTLGIPIKKSGKVTKVQGIIQDITERKKTEQESRLLAQRLILATDAASIGIWDWDLQTDLWYATPIYYSMLGYEPDTGFSDRDRWIKLIHPEDINRIKEIIQAVLSGKDVPYQYEARILHADGTYRWINVVGRILEKDEKGKATRLLGIRMDITKRKQTEESLKKSEEKLRQSQKMEAIGTLAGGIAHDFNNILTAILGFAELAKTSKNQNLKFTHYLEEILKAGVRAKELVKQILTFSRQTEIKKDPMELTPLIKESLRFLKASLPSTIDIRQELKAGNSMVVADPTQIHQIIMNLCTNASYAMKKKGGLLNVSLKEVDIDDMTKIIYEGLNSGRYLQLTVSDTGEGIPEEIIQKIFDPFFSTKERGEGTGMGLSVVHGIVKDMGGAVSVHSETGIGTTFRVLVPKYEGPATEARSSDTSARSGSGTILFVDDEIQIIESVQEILKHLGYNVFSATDPAEALRLFNLNPDAFDLVLTDMTMPGMTGLDLSEQLILIRPDIPVILCTGFDQDIKMERLKNIGIRALVMKPIITAELAKVIYSTMNPDVTEEVY